jgi:hypothetical protein
VADERRHLTAPHADLATNVNGLARVAHAQADYASAQQLYQEALAARRQMFGNENIQVTETW